jgi:hypothetical protein
MTTKSKRANEIIGFHLGWDIADVTAGIYQPSRYSSPRVYVCGNDYFCCPSGSQKLPTGFEWKRVGSYYGRDVHRAEPNDD